MALYHTCFGASRTRFAVKQTNASVAEKVAEALVSLTLTYNSVSPYLRGDSNQRSTQATSEKYTLVLHLERAN